jgi:hypothetical protein
MFCNTGEKSFDGFLWETKTGNITYNIYGDQSMIKNLLSYFHSNKMSTGG